MKARFLAVALLLAPWAVAADPVVVQGADLKLLGEVKAIASRVAGLLGIRDAGTPAAIRADAAARRALLEAAESLPAERLAARGRSWEDLGLGERGLPARLRRILAEDLEGAALDGDGRRLMVDPGRLSDADFAPGTPGTDAASLLLVAGVRPDEPMLAHYVDHARAGWTAARFPDTTDAWLAAAAWAEGRANLAALSLLFEGVGLIDAVADGKVVPSSVLGGSLVPEPFQTGSPVERALLFFVYEEGFAQAALRLKAGGFGRIVSEAGVRRTTRDVLHPDRAPFGGDLPEVPPPPAGFRVADRDVLGEQGIITVISTLTGKDNLGLLAGDGWAGDVLVRHEPDAGNGDGYTLWVVRAVDEPKATDFAYGVLRGFEERYAGLKWEGDAASKSLRSADRIVRFRRNGTVIRIRIASPTVDAALEKSSVESAPRRAPSSTK
ncbi:MAG TPA: hypothetical protein VF139_18470 [Candidatus Polarisedimenticolaceae bacterium]